ncbi:MAG: hypothetical protein IT562_20745 [Alphaproteobacteria bacterium]|nr:hypothetical protein [Alphaproteobacteria bacterium]
MEDLTEAVGTFDTSEQLEAAIDALERAGWDRADLSVLAQKDLVLPPAGPTVADAAKAADDADASRSPVVPDVDIRQGRTLAASMAGVIAAFAATGATVVTGGGALAAVVGAAAAGGGATALVHALGRMIGENHDSFLQEQIDRGGILLWVRMRKPGQETRAQEILRQHGGQNVHIHDLSASNRPKPSLIAGVAAARR